MKIVKMNKAEMTPTRETRRQSRKRFAFGVVLTLAVKDVAQRADVIAFLRSQGINRR